MKNYLVFGGFGVLLLLVQGCVGVNTFPMIARSGDTVAVMIGGSNTSRKENVDVSLTDAGGQTWDLRSMGLVRSVFNLRTDALASGMHYSPYLDLYYPWSFGHEPLQTVLVTDLPVNMAPGNATLTVTPTATDDSSGVNSPYNIKLEVIPGSGSPNTFLRKTGFGSSQPAELLSLEQVPHGKITFNSSVNIGAVSLKVGFNNSVLNGNDINVYVPESTVRGTFSSPGAFGATQRMVYWRQDGQYLYLDVVAPQGIASGYLQLYIIHPKGLSGSPNFTLNSSAIYGVDGSVISATPALAYFP